MDSIWAAYERLYTTMTIKYSIRNSQRAKRLQLRVGARAEVEVILPRGMSQAGVPAFVAKHRDWILKTQTRLRSRLPQTPELHQSIPETITFKACCNCWQVQYRLEPGLRSALSESNLLISVSAGDENAARRTLQRWLSRKARSYLLPHMTRLADETGLRFQRLSIRSQKTRWGSCSSTGTISLNRALMFLEPDLVRYLMIHELCHTRQMNHSSRFWRLVEGFEPRYREYERCLRGLTLTVPAWVNYRPDR